MNKNIVLQIKTTEKNGKKYKCAYLVVDLDYTRKILSWDKQDIAEILGYSVADLIQTEDGFYNVGVLYEKIAQ